jgi:hypothetical protein
VRPEAGKLCKCDGFSRVKSAPRSTVQAAPSPKAFTQGAAVANTTLGRGTAYLTSGENIYVMFDADSQLRVIQSSALALSDHAAKPVVGRLVERLKHQRKTYAPSACAFEANEAGRAGRFAAARE